jgi:hypothetical protein
MDSKLWWYAARANGLVAWGLLAASVLWGLTLSTKVLGKRPHHIAHADVQADLTSSDKQGLGGHVRAANTDEPAPTFAPHRDGLGDTAQGRCRRGLTAPMPSRCRRRRPVSIRQPEVSSHCTESQRRTERKRGKPGV